MSEKNMWEKFNKSIDVKGLQADVKEAAENGGTGEYKEVPHGTYEVKVEKMELKASKKGDPMVAIWFKILEGDFKNSILFLNQVITQGFQIHIVNEILRSMDTGVEIEFQNFEQYGNLLMDVHEAINEKLEFALEYGEKKGFNTFKITEVYEV